MAEKQKVVIYSKLMSLLSGMVTNIKSFVASSIAAQKFKTINGNDIKGEGNIEIDLSLYKVVTELPTADINVSKIYLVPDPTSPEDGNNVYIEYMYVAGKWEKMGEYKTSIDLTPYAKTADVYTKDNPGEVFGDVAEGLQDGSIDFAPMTTYLNGKYIDESICGNPGETFVDKINEMNGSYVNDTFVQKADIEYMTDADVTTALATLFPAEG